MNYFLCAVIFILLINISGYKIKEGVTFTNYDNSKLITKPWDNFCLQNPPSCQEDSCFLMNKNFSPIGCWCNNQKSILDNPECSDINYDPFAEIRR